MVSTTMSRLLNQPTDLGQSFMARASNPPIPTKNKKSTVGMSHTKCRVIRYSRFVVLR